MSDSNLQDALQQSAVWPSRFMPNLFESIVSFIPGTSIKKIDGLLKSGIDLRAQRLAIFLAGNFLKRMDSGVTSSISSGPMYSKARSKVI